MVDAKDVRVMFGGVECVPASAESVEVRAPLDPSKVHVRVEACEVFPGEGRPPTWTLTVYLDNQKAFSIGGLRHSDVDTIAWSYEMLAGLVGKMVAALPRAEVGPSPG